MLYFFCIVLVVMGGNPDRSGIRRGEESGVVETACADNSFQRYKQKGKGRSSNEMRT